jgi:hypothetical protein
MKILICGDRNWYDENKICCALLQLNPVDDIIITGGARGADSIAHKIATNLKFKTIVKMADWDKYGLAAGPIRNKQMLDLGPDKVVAFHSNIDSSKGTKDCISRARKMGIPVEMII